MVSRIPQRNLLYITAAIGVILVFANVPTIVTLYSVWAGSTIVCICSLATHLFPDYFGLHSNPALPGRLYYPLGYWNAQGLLAAIATILAIGVACSRRSPTTRGLAAAIVPILALDCFFALSRGALVALGFGLLIWLLIDPERVWTSVWFIAIAVAPILSILVAPKIAVWTQVRGHDGLWGNRVGYRGARSLPSRGSRHISACAVGGFACRSPRDPGFVYRKHPAVLACGLALWAVTAYGGPSAVARSTYDSFTAPMPARARTSQPARLSTLANQDRSELWSVAWRHARMHPLSGSGSGPSSVNG